MLRCLRFSVLLALALPFSAPADTLLDTGQIGGAKFAIARPVEWNNNLLLLLHDYRPESAPLGVDLDPNQALCRGFLDQGWMVAQTSYRRNGVIIADAMADVDALRDYIAKTYGAPERVLLEGESMGGTIVILMAERDDRYDGAVVIDPTLDTRDPGQVVGLSLRPRIPLIFLANQTELNGPRRYVTANVRGATDPAPVLFMIARDGHNNISQRERLAALRMLIGWLDHGPSSLPRPPANSEFFDATLPPAPQPSQVTFLPDGRGFSARVIEADPFTGNLVVNAQPEDFTRAGLGKNSFFQFVARDQSFRVRYSRDFTAVKRGAWLGFPNADGFFLIARNLASAAATANLAAGDDVTIRRYDDAAAPREEP